MICCGENMAVCVTDAQGNVGLWQCRKCMRTKESGNGNH